MIFKRLIATHAAGPKRSKLTIGMISGDGIGREVIPAAQRVLEAVVPASCHLSFIQLQAGFETFQATGVALPERTVEILKSGDVDGAMFGAVSSPSHKVAGYSSPIVALRKKLDLYANVRPVSRPIPSPVHHLHELTQNKQESSNKKIDMVIVRENTECLYIKDERLEVDETTKLKTAYATRKITEFASRRIAAMAMKIALQRKRQTQPKMGKVTVVHKSNVLSVSDGLFRESCLSVWKENEEWHREIKLEEQLVDSMVYRMFREPEVFDVAVAPNLYGDIISDGAAALVGSLGVVASANVGDTFCLGEPVHGSAPDIAGKGLANPIAAIRSAGLLLENLGMTDEAVKIQQAVDHIMLEAEGRASSLLTPDMGGKGSTTDVTDAVIGAIRG